MLDMRPQLQSSADAPRVWRAICPALQQATSGGNSTAAQNGDEMLRASSVAIGNLESRWGKLTGMFTRSGRQKQHQSRSSTQCKGLVSCAAKNVCCDALQSVGTHYFNSTVATVVAAAAPLAVTPGVQAGRIRAVMQKTRSLFTTILPQSVCQHIQGRLQQAQQDKPAVIIWGPGVSSLVW